MIDFAPRRRRALHLAAAALAAPALSACGGSNAATLWTPSTNAPLNAAIARFAALAPDTSNCLLQADAPSQPWSAGHQADRQLFVGSAVKTFILAQFLRDVEAGRNGLSEAQMCEINDAVRTPGSPVFGGLTGQTPYRSALEAMIAHSDNLGTDIALAAAEPDRVRALITQAGLTGTRIPDSTRKLFSYLAGAPSGTDLGWEGMQRIARNEPTGYTSRSDVINTQQTMVSTASEMVSWYRQSLSGAFFQRPETLNEYRRIQAQADALWRTVPSGLMSYGKGGSIDWEDFHALCIAGQMLVNAGVGSVPVSFSFTLNWRGAALSTDRTDEFIAAVADVLRAAATAMRS
jgi:beta-lactamase class A